MAVLFYKWLKKPEIKNTDETINYIIKNRCSVSRFGDGEFQILLGEYLIFQDYHPLLAEKFAAILAQKEDLNHITCIPSVLTDNSELKSAPKEYWHQYFSGNYYYLKPYFTFKKPYYDSLLSRLYMDQLNSQLSKTRFEMIRNVWEAQDILFIEGEQSRLGVGNELFDNARSIKRILCPSLNAFSCYDEVLNYVSINIRKDTLILLALGPTATAMAWDLCKLGYWAIDIGHIDIEYEWMNMGATEKVPVKNKFVGDIFTFSEESNGNLEEYKKSIIKIIN
ncbi:hypothetical protein BIW12_03345 [Flavobacterium commune]|uniref:Glycosyltransferase GT-D fold domain-containing protein n=2 Tax=Flavobacterium commune TaxID=1306519 RepID=A0A1D9P8A8_9FLAO|nr:hypothetical protein BIW12_03345 [Flavobacterium commune]